MPTKSLEPYRNQLKEIEVLRRENKELRNIIIEMKLEYYRDKPFTLRIVKKTEKDIIDDYK